MGVNHSAKGKGLLFLCLWVACNFFGCQAKRNCHPWTHFKGFCNILHLWGWISFRYTLAESSPVPLSLNWYGSQQMGSAADSLIFCSQMGGDGPDGSGARERGTGVCRGHANMELEEAVAPVVFEADWVWGQAFSGIPCEPCCDVLVKDTLRSPARPSFEFKQVFLQSWNSLCF